MGQREPDGKDEESDAGAAAPLHERVRPVSRRRAARARAAPLRGARSCRIRESRADEGFASESYRMGLSAACRASTRSAAAGVLASQAELFTSGNGKGLVVLHVLITQLYSSVALDMEGLWVSVETTLLGGREIPTLCPDDYLLLLPDHGC